MPNATPPWMAREMISIRGNPRRTSPMLATFYEKSGKKGAAGSVEPVTDTILFDLIFLLCRYTL